jgi:hypothetical protein
MRLFISFLIILGLQGCLLTTSQARAKQVEAGSRTVTDPAAPGPVVTAWKVTTTTDTASETREEIQPPQIIMQAAQGAASMGMGDMGGVASSFLMLITTLFGGYGAAKLRGLEKIEQEKRQERKKGS